LQGVSDTAEPNVRLPDLLRLQLRVIGALTLREMSGRYGKENLGYLWLFGEPLLLGSAIGLVHAITGHEMPGGVSPVHFMVTGYIVFYLLRGIVNRAPTAIVGTQSLLYHRCITLLDIMISKNLLDLAATTFVMLLFIGLWGMATGQWPANLELVVVAMAVMALLSHGLSLLIAAGSVFTEVFERVTHLIVYLTMGFTGFLYMVFWLPTEMQHAALWIPTVHVYEMIRHGLYGLQVPTYYDPLYLAGWVLGLNLFGMAALRRARRDLVI